MSTDTPVLDLKATPPTSDTVAPPDGYVWNLLVLSACWYSVVVVSVWAFSRPDHVAQSEPDVADFHCGCFWSSGRWPRVRAVRTSMIGSRVRSWAFSFGSSTPCCTQAGTSVSFSGWAIA